jgi:hypothetical protein
MATEIFDTVLVVHSLPSELSLRKKLERLKFYILERLAVIKKLYKK